MELSKVLSVYVRASVPVLLSGQPGIGKSAGIEAMFAKTPCPACKGGPSHLFVLLASIREPTDIAGWPVRGEKGVVVEGPQWLKIIAEMVGKGHYYGLFIDELRTVSPAKQAPLLRIFNERKVGDYDELPMNVPIIGAANSIEDSAGGWPIEPTLANRFGHVTWLPDVDFWCMGMATGAFVVRTHLPKDALDRLSSERSLLASFIKSRRELLIQMPKDETKRDGPWPSPRSWDMAAHLLATAGEDDTSLREDLLATMVGNEAAVEFVTWQRNMDLPNPQDVLAGSYSIEESFDRNRPDRVYAIVSNVVAYALDHLTSNTWDDVWSFGVTAARNGFTDVFAGFIPSLLTAGEESKEMLSDIRSQYVDFQPLIERL